MQAGATRLVVGAIDRLAGLEVVSLSERRHGGEIGLGLYPLLRMMGLKLLVLVHEI